MIQKKTDTLIPVWTNRATEFPELYAAGWDEKSICLTLSADRQAFGWNSAIKLAVRKAHCVIKKGDKSILGPLPEKLTPAMIATAEAFAKKYPNAFHRFSAEETVGKNWKELAKKSTAMTTLATLKGEAKTKFIAEFKKTRGFEPTIDNIAAAMKKDYENAPSKY